MNLSVQPNPRIRPELVYADEDLLVVNKPAGIVTQPGKGHAKDSLLNGLFALHGAALQNVGAERDWGLLHRLDRGTSGLLVVALRSRAYERLRAEFENRTVKKVYWALTCGAPPTRQGTVQQPILEVREAGQKRAALRRSGQPAVTAYRVVAQSAPRVDAPPTRRSGGPARIGVSADRPVALIEARPATGRLHQIRVHLAHLGCPILGDEVYGRGVKMPRVPRLCLHAARLSFVHPQSNRRIELSAAWPNDLANVTSRYGIAAPE